MRILKIPTFTPFIISQRNIKKSLLIINLGIFLSIFAATSAIISLFIENKISHYETEIIENKQMNLFFNRFERMVNVYEDSENRLYNFNQNFASFNEILDSLKGGEKLIDDREYYYYRFYSYIAFLDENFGEEDDTEWMTYFTEKEFLEYIYDPIVHKKFYDELEAQSIKFKNYVKEYKTFASDLKKIDPFIILSDEQLISNTYEDSVEINQLINKYFTKVFLMNDFLREYVMNIKKIISDWSLSYKSLDLNNYQEIEKLSNLEKKLIIFAFILQIIIFFVTQFFEITFASKVKKRLSRKSI